MFISGHYRKGIVSAAASVDSVLSRQSFVAEVSFNLLLFKSPVLANSHY